MTRRSVPYCFLCSFGHVQSSAAGRGNSFLGRCAHPRGGSAPQGFPFPLGFGFGKAVVEIEMPVLRISGQGATGLRILCAPHRDVAWLGKGEEETGASSLSEHRFSEPTWGKRRGTESCHSLLRFVKWVISPFYEVRLQAR